MKYADKCGRLWTCAIPCPVRRTRLPYMDDRQPTAEDANAALLAWYRHLVAERMVLDEIVEQPTQRARTTITTLVSVDPQLLRMNAVGDGLQKLAFVTTRAEE